MKIPKIYFPICRTERDFRNNQTVKELTDRVHPIFIELMKECQPFSGRISFDESEPSTHNPLFLLTELNNRDKHRLLNVVAHKLTGLDVGCNFILDTDPTFDAEKFFSETPPSLTFNEPFRASGDIFLTVSSLEPFVECSFSVKPSISLMLIEETAWHPIPFIQNMLGLVSIIFSQFLEATKQ